MGLTWSERVRVPVYSVCRFLVFSRFHVCGFIAAAITCVIRGREPVPCYVAEGESLLLHVNVNFSIHTWNLVKDNIVKGSNKQATWLLLNDTLQKNKVFKNDSGIYTLNVFDKNGKGNLSKIQLNVEGMFLLSSVCFTS